MTEWKDIHAELIEVGDVVRRYIGTDGSVPRTVESVGEDRVGNVKLYLEGGGVILASPTSILQVLREVKF